MKNSFEKRTIKIDTAFRLIDAAQEKAKEIGIAIAVAIVDESGVIKAFSRMDGAPLIAVDASRKKAVTAVGFGLSTGKKWHDFIKDDPILKDGVHNFEDFMLLGGGIPIYEDKILIGAIGISGGHYSQDEQCGLHAVHHVFS